MFAVPCRLIHTPYELNFRVERDHTVLCTKELSGRELKKFRKVRGSAKPWLMSRCKCSACTWILISAGCAEV